MLKGRCLPVRTAWKQLWCSKAAAGCQPAPLGSSFGAQTPLRIASPHRLEATLVLTGRCRLPARIAWKQLWPASPHRLEAALVIERRCGLPACTAPHCLEAALVLKDCCGLPAAPLASSFRAQRLLRAASPHRLETAFEFTVLRAAAGGCQPAPLEAALVLKGRCGLPAHTSAHRWGRARVCAPICFQCALHLLRVCALRCVSKQNCCTCTLRLYW